MKLTNYLSIRDSVDFFDVDVDTDTPFFFDPYLVLTDMDQNSCNFKLSIESFFTTVTSNFYEDKDISYLFNHFEEIKENRLGLSSDGSISGNGTGPVLSEELEREIKKYLKLYPETFETFDELSLFVKGISNDRISDMTTRICFLDLFDYTKAQIAKYHMKVEYSTRYMYIWNRDLLNWEYREFNLPLINGDCLILTPKKYCASKIKLGSFHEFVQIGVLGYLKNNYEFYKIPPKMKLTKDGIYVEIEPTKKSIVEHYTSQGINLFDAKQIENVLSKEELQQTIAHFKACT